VNYGYTRGLLTFETDPMGNETHYSYDENNLLVLENHPNTGISIEYGYDLRNRPIFTREIDQMGNHFETQMSYDASGYKHIEVDQFGNETIYNNDSLGRPISITYPEVGNGPDSSIKPTYAYTYDLFDNPISVTDPIGRVLTQSYNIQGKPVEINYLDGTKEAFRYNSGGGLHLHCSRNGVIEIFEHDYIGRVKKVKYYTETGYGSGSSFKETSCTYNAFHKTSEVDPLDCRTSYIYDGAGHLTKLKKKEEILEHFYDESDDRPNTRIKKVNQKVEFFYDDLGRTQAVKIWKSFDDFTLEVKEYDLLDRVVEERTEDFQGYVLTKIRYVYNDAGQLAQIIGYPQNKESVLVHYEYDGFGRLSKSTNTVGATTQIFYDDAYINDWGQKGRKRTLIDPVGNQTEEVYDNNDNLIKVIKKDTCGQLLSDIEMFYDSSGNKVSERAHVIAPDGASRIFEIEQLFNKENQLASITLGKGTAEERTTRFEYNSHGNLAEKYNPGSSEPINYRYNAQGNLCKVFYREEEKQIQFKLSYDQNENLTEIYQSSSLFIRYQFNSHDDLLFSENITDEFGSYRVCRTYDDEGKIHTLQFPDRSFVEYTYEGPFVKRVSRFSKEKKELYSYQVASRDQMGNILKEMLPGSIGEKTQNWDEAGRRVEIATDFFQDKVLEGGYDLLGNIKERVTTLDEEEYIADYDYNSLLQLVGEKSDREHTYSYDSIGNRLQKDSSVYKINELNQLIEAEGVSYTFHPDGNIATKTIDGNTWTYQSNPLNQIISIKDPHQNTITFIYDLMGKRLSKHISSKGKKTKIFRFFYLGDTEIGCVDEKGVVIELKIPGNPNNPEDSCVAIEIKKEVYVPIYDLQGNIVCLLDPTKRKIVESYRYSVYGEEEIKNARGKLISDSSIGNPWRYRGKRVDKEVGLIYFGYRYYDPKIGRWISPDPIGTVDGPNLYAFVHNNPIKYVDYFGFKATFDENCGCIYHNHPGWHNAPRGCVCICGGDGSKGSPLTTYQSTTGSNLKSYLGGAAHGVMDYVINSVHDLQTNAAYMGSEDLGLNFQERIQMIDVIEQCQVDQKALLGDMFMDMLSIDPSDAIYQSFRANTTLGLEIGSFVAGGYGTVKGVMALNKLAKMPNQITKVTRLASRISSNPLQGTNYTPKVFRQMRLNRTTGKPDFHAFPRIVDNYAKLGQKELITGADGISRMKISLAGSYQGKQGFFEWIIEANKSVNHRIFNPKP
jgi:RHS repeat-associated protein